MQRAIYDHRSIHVQCYLFYNMKAVNISRNTNFNHKKAICALIFFYITVCTDFIDTRLYKTQVCFWGILSFPVWFKCYSRYTNSDRHFVVQFACTWSQNRQIQGFDLDR